MLQDFIKTQTIKKQNKLEVIIDDIKHDILRESDQEKSKKLTESLHKYEHRLQEVKSKIALLKNKKAAKEIIKKEKLNI